MDDLKEGMIKVHMDVYRNVDIVIEKEEKTLDRWMHV